MELRSVGGKLAELLPSSSWPGRFCKAKGVKEAATIHPQKGKTFGWGEPAKLWDSSKENARNTLFERFVSLQRRWFPRGF